MSVRFVIGASASYLAVILADRAASILLIPLMTRALTPTDYGVMLLIVNGSALINLMFGFCLLQALPTLFANAATDADRRAVSTSILAAFAAISGLLHVAAALFARQISLFFLQTTAYASTIALGALWSFLAASALSMLLVVRLTERHRLYLLVQIPALLVQIGLIVWLLLVVGMGVDGYYVASSAAVGTAALIYAKNFWHWISGPVRWGIIVKAMGIAVQMLPWQFALLLATNTAAIFLTRLGQVEAAGLFTVANGAAGLLMVASNCFEMVWTPYVLLRKDAPDLAPMQVRMFAIFSSALLVGAAALCLFAHELFAVLVGPAFREGYRLVPGLVLAYCIYGFAHCFAQGLQARQRMQAYGWVGLAASAVFLGLSLTLVRTTGPIGIVAAMIGAFVTMLILLQWVSYRLMPVDYPWARHLLMWVVAGTAVVLAFPLALSWQAAALKLAVLAAIAGLPFLFGAVRLADLNLAKAWIFAPSR
jgi:O-antigen/teichoic acid export membrane protein